MLYRQGRIEPTLGNQHFGQQTDKALRNGKGDMLAIRAQRAAIPFIDDPPLVQHNDAVGIICIQRIGPGQGPAIKSRKRDRIDILPLGARQRRNSPGTPHSGGRQQLAPM